VVYSHEKIFITKHDREYLYGTSSAETTFLTVTLYCSLFIFLKAANGKEPITLLPVTSLIVNLNEKLLTFSIKSCFIRCSSKEE